MLPKLHRQRQTYGHTDSGNGLQCPAHCSGLGHTHPPALGPVGGRGRSLQKDRRAAAWLISGRRFPQSREAQQSESESEADNPLGGQGGTASLETDPALGKPGTHERHWPRSGGAPSHRRLSVFDEVSLQHARPPTAKESRASPSSSRQAPLPGIHTILSLHRDTLSRPEIPDNGLCGDPGTW